VASRELMREDINTLRLQLGRLDGRRAHAVYADIPGPGITNKTDHSNLNIQIARIARNQDASARWARTQYATLMTMARVEDESAQKNQNQVSSRQVWPNQNIMRIIVAFLLEI
jgi:hypothetical protein